MTKKEPLRNEPQGHLSCILYMFKYFVLIFINDVLHLPHGQIKLLSQWLVAYPIQQPPPEYFAVPFAEYPLINKMLQLRA